MDTSEYILYKCSRSGCKSISERPGDCEIHGERLIMCKMVDAQVFRVAENAIRAICGGHIADPVALAEETFDRLYPSIVEASKRDRGTLEEPTKVDGVNAEKETSEQQKPEELADFNGTKLVISQQDGD